MSPSHHATIPLGGGRQSEEASTESMDASVVGDASVLASGAELASASSGTTVTSSGMPRTAVHEVAVSQNRTDAAVEVAVAWSIGAVSSRDVRSESPGHGQSKVLASAEGCDADGARLAPFGCREIEDSSHANQGDASLGGLARIGRRVDKRHADAKSVELCYEGGISAFVRYLDRNKSALFDELHPVRQAPRLMWRFARIAPFPDFNLVMSFVLMNRPLGKRE